MPSRKKVSDRLNADRLNAETALRKQAETDFQKTREELQALKVKFDLKENELRNCHTVLCQERLKVQEQCKKMAEDAAAVQENAVAVHQKLSYCIGSTP